LSCLNMRHLEAASFGVKPSNGQTADGGGLELRPISETRILGVLQRIALCYFFASVILYYGSRNFAIWFSFFALLSYWVLMYTFGDSSDPYSMVGNFGSKLDLIFLGEKHLYHGEGIAFEPEGLLSTLPSIVNVLGGYLVGDYVRKNKSSFESIAKLMLVGAVLIFAALTWDMFFPINKKLWTSSFVLLTTGLGVIILAVLMYVLDIKKIQNWTYFFEVFGRNPLFIYLLSELALISLIMVPSRDDNARDWLFHSFFGSFASPIHASFLFAAFFMLACWAVGYVLDKKKIYIRV
jgi:predicted acyltransferase